MAFSLLGSLVILFISGVLHGVGFLQEMSVFESFTSSRFSFVHHPTYLSVYALFGVELLRSNRDLLQGKLFFRNGLLTLLVIIQLMSMSLAGLLALFVYVLVIFGICIKRELGRKWMAILGSLLIVLVTGMATLIQPVKLQILTALDSFELYASDPEGFVRSRQTYVTGNETRLIMWTASSYEVAEHPFGVGIGNVNLHLEERLKALKQSDSFIAHHYDPHNQFLMTWLEVGFFGLFCLFLIIWLSIRTGWRHGNTLLIILGLSLFFQCLFESMLQRQSGIVFFTFWICLLASYVQFGSESHKKRLS
jgi:O-antigen ligase